MFSRKKKRPRIQDAKTHVRQLKAMLEEHTKGCNGRDISEAETKEMEITIKELLGEDQNEL